MKTYIILASSLLLLAFAICVSCAKAEKEVWDALTQARLDAMEAYRETKGEWFNKFERGKELSMEDAIKTIKSIWMNDPFAIVMGYDYIIEFMKIQNCIETLYREGFVISKVKETGEGK